ncbi:MAG TPA: O-antigen ligase domain-containing protein, partial [Actinoplanes sp.]|nr:O-antigen ligase domain-containing protein [Actinoplanes sp.]
MSDLAVATDRAVRRRRIRRTAALPMWPLTVMFGLLPLWWVLGAWYLIWPVFGLVLAVLMLLRGTTAMPTGTACWLIFLGIVLISATRLDEPSSLLTFGLRFGHLFTAFVVGLYVYTVARQGTSWHRIAGPLCVFWLSVVVLGWSGVLAPTLGMSSPVQMLLPGGLGSERFIADITHLDTTEYNPHSSNPIYRPAAPYPYTNNWGTAYSFLVPFVLAYVTSCGRRPMRTVLLVSLPLSLVPAFYTLNRGMFIGLGAGVVYLLSREVVKGRIRLVVPVIGLLLL